MIYLPVKFLEPGMVLARSVPSANPRVALLVNGQRLTQDAIGSLLQHGIKGLYIENAYSDDIEYEEILDPEQKAQILSQIKTQFDKVTKQRLVPDYKVITSVAESIVMSVLQQGPVLHSVMDIRDYDGYTYSHSLYVGIIAVILGKSMNMNAAQLDGLAKAGILHDIGKLDIPAKIINKPGALTMEEYELIKEHPLRAVTRLRGLSGCGEAVLQGIVTHHECFDGSGYPGGLSGRNIPQYGKILAIADVYDALNSKRSYRDAWSPAKVIDYITSRSGTHFDPDILQSFLSAIAAYPVGSVVRLSDGCTAIVIRNNPGMALRPTIRLIAPTSMAGTEIDLSSGSLHITIMDTPGSLLAADERDFSVGTTK